MREAAFRSLLKAPSSDLQQAQIEAKVLEHLIQTAEHFLLGDAIDIPDQADVESDVMDQDIEIQ